MVKITKFGDKIALFLDIKLLRKKETKSTKIGTVGKFGIKSRDCPSKIGTVSTYVYSHEYLCRS